MYVSEESLKDSIDYLKNLDVEEKKILGDFFLLKYVGLNDSEFTSVDDQFRSKGHEAAQLMMSLFSEDEKLPENYEMIDPFKMEWGSARSTVSERSKKYGRTRLKNNVVGGSTKWRSIVSEEGGKMKFTEDYIEELVELCSLNNNKIDISALACWALRERKIDSDVENPQKVLVSSFKKLFNINLSEEQKLFVNELDIEFSENKVDMSEIRDYIGEPPEEWEFTEDNQNNVGFSTELLTQDVMISDLELPTSSEVKELLEDYKQIILYGPPGTGKTWLSNEVFNNNDKYDEMKFVQFHPNYSYENFVGGLRPNDDGGFDHEIGPLLDILEMSLNNPENHYLLIIDEINRANLSKVLGELFVGLDRDYENITVSGDVEWEQLTLPENLHIIGTMNSSDRSIAIVDNALRRRFGFVYTPPSPELLESKTDDSALEEVKIPLLFEKINKGIVETIGDKEMKLGHTFFMPDFIEDDGIYVWSWEDLEKTINHSIVPLVEEYCSGQKSEMKNILGDLTERPKDDEFKSAVKSVLG